MIHAIRSLLAWRLNEWRALRIRFLVAAALLTTYWPGHVSRDPATTMGACDAAGRAWMVGRGLPIGEHFPALSFRCEPMSPAGAGFKAGWDRIGGRR